MVVLDIKEKLQAQLIVSSEEAKGWQRCMRELAAEGGCATLFVAC